MQSQDEEMAEATNEARAEEDQGKDEDKIENKVRIFQSLESKETKMIPTYVPTKNVNKFLRLF